MDKLDELFRKQEELQNKLGYDFSTMTDQQRSAYIIEYSQHLDHEMHEMLQELPFFKSWKKYPEYDLEEAKQEFADALHFFLNVAMGLGFTADSLFFAFLGKNIINHVRQENTTEYKKCVED